MTITSMDGVVLDMLLNQREISRNGTVPILTSHDHVTERQLTTLGFNLDAMLTNDTSTTWALVFFQRFADTQFYADILMKHDDKEHVEIFADGSFAALSRLHGHGHWTQERMDNGMYYKDDEGIVAVLSIVQITEEDGETYVILSDEKTQRIDEAIAEGLKGTNGPGKKRLLKEPFTIYEFEVEEFDTSEC